MTALSEDWIVGEEQQRVANHQKASNLLKDTTSGIDIQNQTHLWVQTSALMARQAFAQQVMWWLHSWILTPPKKIFLPDGLRPFLTCSSSTTEIHHVAFIFKVKCKATEFRFLFYLTDICNLRHLAVIAWRLSTISLCYTELPPTLYDKTKCCS